MKIIHQADAQEFKNSDNCIAYEYPLGDKDINGALIKLNGRYPDEGYVVNEICKELVYVVKGKGQLTSTDHTESLKTGDMALLLPGEKFYFEGKLELLMPCAPAWSSAQHKNYRH